MCVTGRNILTFSSPWLSLREAFCYFQLGGSSHYFSPATKHFGPPKEKGYLMQCSVFGSIFIEWFLVLALFIFPHSLVRFPTVYLFMFIVSLYWNCCFHVLLLGNSCRLLQTNRGKKTFLKYYSSMTMWLCSSLRNFIYFTYFKVNIGMLMASWWAWDFIFWECWSLPFDCGRNELWLNCDHSSRSIPLLSYVTSWLNLLMLIGVMIQENRVFNTCSKKPQSMNFNLRDGLCALQGEVM